MENSMTPIFVNPHEHPEFDDDTQSATSWQQELLRAKAGDPLAAWRFRRLDAYCIMQIAHMARGEVRVVDCGEINFQCALQRRGRASWRTAIERTKQVTGCLRYEMEYHEIQGRDFMAIRKTL